MLQGQDLTVGSAVFGWSVERNHEVNSYYKTIQILFNVDIINNTYYVEV